MRTATVRELRNNFARIAAWIAAGEEVEITNRGKAVANVGPAKSARPWTPPSFDTLMEQSKKIWENEEQDPLSEEDFQKMLDYIKAEREF